MYPFFYYMDVVKNGSEETLFSIWIKKIMIFFLISFSRLKGKSVWREAYKF